MSKPFTADVKGGLPFVEAIDYARSRKVELPDDYYGNAVQAHRAKATTVTGAASVDQIQAVIDDLNKAIANGTTFEEWKKNPSVEALGLSNARLDNIFRTNVQAAYNRGRWQQQMASLTRTYWMYDAINDSRVRPTHLAMDNTVLSRDNPWWEAHYPPNGYRCRCTVIALTPKQAEARGITPIAPDVQPDVGWAYNPGSDYTAPDKKLLTAAPDAPPAAQTALDRAKAALVRMQLPYNDLYAQGTATLTADIEAAGGTFGNLTEAQGLKVHEAFTTKLEKLAEGPAHKFNVQTVGGGRSPTAVARTTKEFYGRLPQRWQSELADALQSRPLTVEDGLKRDGKRKRGGFTPSQMHFSSPSDELNVITHEAAHVLQFIAPDIDRYFQLHHEERTAGEALQSLKKLQPAYDYDPREVTRPDKYFTAYVGKEYFPPFDEDTIAKAVGAGEDTSAYHGRALELMSKVFEAAFTNKFTFVNIASKDPRLLSVLYGLLFHYG